MLINFYVNIGYCKNYKKLTHVADGEKSLSPQTLSLSFLMLAAGIHRLFDKSAVYEFLCRMAILMKNKRIIDNFFKDDSLFIIEAYGYKYTVTVKDIQDHLGMEVSNSPYDIIERKEWLKNVKEYWKAACIIGLFESNPMLEKTAIAKNVYRIGAKPDTEVDEKYQRAVDLFAREGLKSIPEKAFEETKFRATEARQRIANTRKELSKRLQHRFDYKKISMDVKEEIFNIVFPHIENKETMLFEPMFICLVRLAFLWANGYVKIYDIEWEGKKLHSAEVDPRVDFDYQDYDGLNSLEFGVNIYDTYYDYHLDKVAHLLKEPK